MLLSDRLLKLARTPAQRRKALQPKYQALWDALGKYEPTLKKLGYRKTAAQSGAILFLFKDTDVRVTLNPSLNMLGRGEYVSISAHSPTWHRPSTREPNWVDVQHQMRELSRRCTQMSFSADPKEVKRIVAFLSEIAPELDAMNALLETPEISSE